jgi:pantoate--beta-alanine ligase
MSIESIGAVDQLRRHLSGPRQRGEVIGLVPTMGALHEGHGSLVDRARAECDFVVVSIFVNPTQFGPDEDLELYPRSLADDFIFCEARKVDAIFAPSEEAMYPEPLHTLVEPGIEASRLCGASRPGHFKGVATIVLKFLNTVGPDRAYFGEKDFQQLRVVSQMVKDFDLPVEIVACPTHRENDGLAVASRNGYLSSEEREVAGILYRALRVARERIGDGEGDSEAALDAARTVIGLEPLARIDYIEVVDPVHLQPVEKVINPVRVVGAVWIGETRLIDNIFCDSPKKVLRRRKS